MKIALVGSRGYWAKNLRRVITELGHEIVAEIGSNGEDDIIGLDADAAVIATPAETHFEIAMNALGSGMDVLVEKPMCLSAHECCELVDLAHHEGRMLGVDHTYVHSEIFDFLKTQGAPRSYQSLRMAPPLDHVTLPAGWDSVVHDFAMLHALGVQPVNCVGSQDGPIAQAAMEMAGGGSAFIMASRDWVMKVRQVVVQFENESFYWIDNRLYGSEGEIIMRETVEPLKRMFAEFAERCEKREFTGKTDGEAGTVVCDWLEKLYPSEADIESGTAGGEAQSTP